MTVQPAAVEVAPGEPITFDATVYGTDVQDVVWQVAELDGGAIDSSGQYLPPNVPGTYRVVATSTLDETAVATATVTVLTDEEAAAQAAAQDGTGQDGPGAEQGPALAGAAPGPRDAALAPVTAPAAAYPVQTRTFKNRTQPSTAEPALGASIKNPGTSWDLTSPAGDTYTKRVADKPHHYAKDSPWNADETLARLNDGTILNGSTYAPTGVKVTFSEHSAWSNVDPRYVYGVQGTAWARVDARTGARTTIATYGSFGDISFGAYEGTIAADDSAVALVGNRKRIPFAIDPRTGAILCRVKSGGSGNLYDGSLDVDNVGISQDGKFLVAHWNTTPDSINVYAIPQSGQGPDATCTFVWSAPGMNSHYDTCVSAAGRQVLVSEPGVMYDLATGGETQIFERDQGLLHISCRNTKRPGWVYISNDNAESSCSSRTGGEHYQRVYALKLDTSGTRENYAWAHSKCPSSYAAATMAAPSPSGTRVWFKGNWDGQTSAVHSYVAQR